MHVLAALLCTVVTQVGPVQANVEKTVFLAPVPAAPPNARPDIEDLHLHVLSHTHTILPTQLPVQFPSKATPRGLESWYLLPRLEAGRRYEVRICWPATQPTSFWLDTFTIDQVFDTPQALSSLARYRQQLQESDTTISRPREAVDSTAAQSLLLLRIQAAAAYYTTNRTLMLHPELVDVDIILDPFLLNILPQSLAPFAAYITIVAIGAWFLSGYVYRWLLSIAAEPIPKPHTD